jgi:hypothetical protein
MRQCPICFCWDDDDDAEEDEEGGDCLGRGVGGFWM